MRELSVQASTDTLNDNDRASINLEFQALKDELTRISNATEYNNMNVLNGTYQSNDSRGQWRIQIGADNDVNNQHQFSLIDSTATGLGLQPDVKATDLPSLATVVNNGEVEIHIDKTTGNFTDSSNSNAVKLELDGSSLYVVGMKSTTLSSTIDASNNGDDIVVADPTGFDSGGGTVVINGDQITYGGITTTSTSSLEITSSGNVTFTDSGQSLGSSKSFGVELGDVDNDGDLDAFVANFNDQPNKVRINDGSGNFTDSGQALGASDSLGITLADVDNDGDLDAFVANHTPGNVGGQSNRVWINDGNGTFTDSGQSLGSSTSHGIAMDDVDDDGDLDAFVTNANNQANKVWLNDGNGTFTEGQSLGSSHSEKVSLGDLDNDGDLDAFITNWQQGNKVWFNERTDVGDITSDQAASGAYTLTYDDASTFSLSRDGGTAVDYVLTTDPASTGSPETATFNLDGNDITIELKQGYDQLDGSDFSFSVQNTTTHQLTGLSDIAQSHGNDASVLSVHTVNDVGLAASSGTWTTDVGEGNGLFNNVSGNSDVTDINAVGGYSYDTNVLSVDDIDHAIDKVNQERSYIGSEQNKLQFTMSNLSSNIQNIEASRSSIEDADFVAEAADLAKNQILAQSATAMLAQASAISQKILSLLR